MEICNNFINSAAEGVHEMRQIYPFEFLKVSPSLVIRIFMGYLGLLWSTVYIYFLVRNLREGWPRLIAAAPLVVLFLLYPPLMFDRHQETLMVVISTFYVSWLGSQRLLGLVWGKGELCQVRSFLYFSLGFFSPFRFIPPNTTIAPGERVPKVQDGFLSLVKGTTKFYLLIVFMYLSYYVHGGIIKRTLTFGAVTYYGASYMADLLAAVGSLIFRMQLAPSFNSPFLSCSLSEFWGHRWNLTYASLSSDTIFKPVSKYFAERGRPTLGMVLGVFGVFACSAFFAELVLYHCFGHPTYEWCCFFLLQCLFTLIERLIQHLFHPRLPFFLKQFLTMSFLALSTEYFLWPPMIRMGLESKVFPQYLALVGLSPHHGFVSE